LQPAVLPSIVVAYHWPTSFVVVVVVVALLIISLQVQAYLSWVLRGKAEGLWIELKRG